MRRVILAMAMLAAPAATLLPGGPVQAQAMQPRPCDTVIEIQRFESRFSERGYWSNSVTYRNKSTGRVWVTTGFSGSGAIIGTREVAPGSFTTQEVARTPGRLSEQELRTQTNLTCNVMP